MAPDPIPSAGNQPYAPGQFDQRREVLNPKQELIFMERALFNLPQKGTAGYDPLALYGGLKQIVSYILGLFGGVRPLGGRLREFAVDLAKVEEIAQMVDDVELPVTPSPEIELFAWRGVGEYIITRTPNEPAIHVASPDLATGVRLAREADLIYAAELGNKTLWKCWRQAHWLLAKYGVLDFNTKVYGVATGYDTSTREADVKRAGEIAATGQRTRAPSRSDLDESEGGDEGE